MKRELCPNCRRVRLVPTDVEGQQRCPRCRHYFEVRLYFTVGDTNTPVELIQIDDDGRHVWRGPDGEIYTEALDHVQGNKPRDGETLPDDC